MGLTVGTIKHTSRDVEDDVIGKDSQRHASSGAAASVLVTPGRTTARRLGAEENLETVLSRELADCDLVLVEGYKSLPVPKIEIRRSGIAAVPVEGAKVRISDEPPSDSLVTLPFDDWEGIVAAILRLAGLGRLKRESVIEDLDSS
jgi:molybdopterin-guanine dinucleotide biosynthesis protein B